MHLHLALIGLIAGLAGGLLGIGGSIVMIPAMSEIVGPNQHLYQAAAMIVNFFVAVPAVYQHSRAAAVDRSSVMRLVPLALVAVIAGVLLSELPIFKGERDAYLRLLFAGFLLALCCADLRGMWLARRRAREPIGSGRDSMVRSSARSEPTVEPANAPRYPWRFAAAVAIPTGLVAGALGVGGGILAVPLQRRFLKVPMRTAIANSAAVIVATSLVGAIVKNYAYLRENHFTTDSFELAFILIPTAIMGSYLGSRLVHVLPVRAIKLVFFVVLLFFAVRLSRQAVADLRRINSHAGGETRAALAEPGEVHPDQQQWTERGDS